MGNRIPIPVIRRLPANYGLYMLVEDCGNITDDNQCASYDDRPVACGAYEVGSDECLSARAAFGLDGHEAYQEIGRVIPEVRVTIPGVIPFRNKS